MFITLNYHISATFHTISKINFVKTSAQNRYLNYLINPSFQGVNRLFVLTFENEDGRTSHSTYYLPNVEIKDYNVMIDGRNVF